MAGAILTQSERELARIGDKNFLAMKTAKGKLKETQALNADLRKKMAQMQESIDKLQSQRDTAEAQIARLLDDADRLTRERDNARKLANAWKMLARGQRLRINAVVDAALAKDAEIGALAGKLAQAQAVVDAARDTVKTWERLCNCVDEFGAGSEYCGEQADVVDKRIIEMRTALSDYDAAQEPEAKP